MNFRRIFQWVIVAGLALEGVAGVAHATLTGNPLTDGWNMVGNSAQLGNYNASGSYPPDPYFSADMYTSEFTLQTGSQLITTGGAFNWNVGDTIVGVGGMFNPAGNNTTVDDSYRTGDGATDIRFVVKYGSTTATWAPSSAGDVPWQPGNLPTAPAYGSLVNGGPGSILLGTSAYIFFPAISGQFVTPVDSPEEQTNSGTVTISGSVGRVATVWSGSAVVGFESVLDLTLLDALYPTANVLPGNEYVLDLQDNKNEFQLSQADVATVPDRTQTVVLLAGATALAVMGRCGLRRAQRAG